MFAVFHDPSITTHHPIYSSRLETRSTRNATSDYDPNVSLNRKILTGYALRALADHNKLSGCLVEGFYTYQVYGEDLNFLYGNRVMFAKRKDVEKLVQIMEAAAGEERMHVFKRSINSNEPDEITKIGMEFRAKWKKEGLPI